MHPSRRLRLTRRFGALLIVPITLLLPAAGANAASTTTFLETAGARVEQANPHTRFGGLKLQAQGGKSLIRTYLKFAPTDLNGTVTKATLSIVPLDDSGAGFTVHGAASSSWEKSTITWANAPAMTSTAVSASQSYPCCQRVAVDVTPLVKGNGAVSFVLASTSRRADAYKNIDWGTSAAPQLIVTTASALAAPSSLSASAGDSQVSLTWGAASGASGYRVYRGSTMIAQTSGTSYTDTQLTNGVAYSYHVVAYDSTGNVSPQSGTVSATPLAPAPAPSTAPSVTTYYVSTSGSDSNAGTSSAPWRTIARAASLAGAGSRVVIRAGAYGEDVTLSKSGTQSSPITFVPDAGATVSTRSLNFAASHLVFSGITISGAVRDCVTVQPALTNITISNATITSCGRHGVGFTRPTTQTYTSDVMISGVAISRVGLSSSAGNNVTIYGDRVSVVDSDLSVTPNDAINLWGDKITVRRNLIHDISNTNGNHNDAIQTWTGMNDGAEGRPVTNLVVAQNTIRNITGGHAHVIMAEGPGHRDWTIYNNLIQNIGDQSFVFGISGGPGIANVNVYNNTFVSAGANNTMEFNGQTTGRLVNNIFYNCVGWGRSVPYWIATGASVTRGYNLAGGTTTPLRETGAVNADPRFVNASSDFRLAAGSPAIDAGDSSMTRSYDLVGKATVGIVDIGAYEY